MILLYDISQSIRQRGGDIFSIEPGPFGTLFRATLANHQIRIGVHRTGASEPFPHETNSPLHVATDQPGLDAFLDTIALQPTPQKKG